VADWIVRYTESDALVCHNAGFDIGVIRYACLADGIPWPSVDFLCTLVLARRAYRLPFVAAQCDVDFRQHHQARDDARRAALIAVSMARKQGDQTLADLAESFRVSVGHMETGYYAPSAGLRPGGHGCELIRPDANPDADPGHPFHGRVIVFTGALMSRTRQMAWDDVVKAGGILEPDVTQRTNILVLGDINPAVLAPGMITTGKAAKVFALQDKGQDIELMTEDDFLRNL
jgi:Exonuclease